MDYEHYQRIIGNIAKRIDQISTRTAQMAVAHSANVDNEEFRELMTKFDSLVAESEEVSRKMLESLGGESSQPYR